jgi:hypothetical protein
MRVAELTLQRTKRIEDAIIRRQITERNARIMELLDRWDEIRNAVDRIIGDEVRRWVSPCRARLAKTAYRVADYIAGGGTGFMVKDFKGKDGEPSPRY